MCLCTAIGFFMGSVCGGWFVIVCMADWVCVSECVCVCVCVCAWLNVRVWLCVVVCFYREICAML